VPTEEASAFLDQVAFPMPWHQPVFDLWQTHINADHLRDLATTIHTAKARSARRIVLAQTDDDQLLAQFTEWQGIDGVIDRLAIDICLSSCCATLRQSARETNAHGAYEPPARSARYPETAFASVDKPGGEHGSAAGHAHGVATTGISIAAQLSDDGRGAAIQHAGDSSLAQAPKLTQLGGDAFFNTAFLVRHASTAPHGQGVTLSFCRRPVLWARQSS